MTIVFHAHFVKSFKKLSKKQKEKFEERLRIFEKDLTHPLLKNHALHGKYSEYRSINITGDIRALYIEVEEEVVLFVEIGTHADLYS